MIKINELFYGIIGLCCSMIPAISIDPVILVHRGTQNYVSIAIKQAQVFNKRVILLTDSPQYFRNVEAYDLNDFFGTAQCFEHVYKHLSPNTQKFELFCIQRWFILNEFVAKMRISHFFHCDSDVLLYCNVSTFYQQHRDKVWLLGAVSNGLSAISGYMWSGGIGYFSREILQQFCDFVSEVYTQKDRLDYLVKKYEKRSNPKHGVCDMTLFSLFVDHLKHSGGQDVMSLTAEIDGAKFDHHISSDEAGFYAKEKVADLEVKKIIFKNRMPYCFNKKTGDWVRLFCIHFQGKAKPLMAKYASIG